MVINPNENDLTYQLMRNAEANDDNPDAPSSDEFMCIHRDEYERIWQLWADRKKEEANGAD